MKLPPLGPLRAFEAAGRHLSFTRAAQELHVTQGAVSQQIRTLEEQLGFGLFHRLPRGLALTEDGLAFHLTVSSALRQIADKADSLKRRDAQRPVTVSTVPSFAVKWLIPRLAVFRRDNPDIAIRVDADHRLVDLRTGEIDLAVRFSEQSFPQLHCVELFRDRVFPVCSPDLIQQGKAPRRPEDLGHAVLLHDTAPLWSDSESDWAYWIRAVGLSGVEAAGGPGFTQADMVLQAAILGDGIALTRSSLAEFDLASGRLVKPLALSIPCPRAHYVVCLAAALERPNVRLFHDWLVAEGRRVQPDYQHG